MMSLCTCWRRQTWRPAIEVLEDRTVPTTNMTQYEQLMLELINRARADPVAEAALHGIALNEGLAPGTISPDAKQPLAPNQNLLNSIRNHLAWLGPRNPFPANPHVGSGGSTLGGRATAAGYTWNFIGENLSYYTSFTTIPDLADEVIEHHRMLFRDLTVPSRGHRLNILNPDFEEIGSAVHNTNRFMTGQNFGRRAGDNFLTGVVFTDAITDDNFYTVLNNGTHEGIGGVTITATNAGGTFSTISGTSGNYAIRLPAGTYNVTATGGGHTFTSFQVIIGASNVKVDLVPGPDITSPTASSDPADLNTGPNSNPYSFTVNFSDNAAINVSTLNNAVRVTGPNGFQLATLTNVSPAGNGSPRTATYEITPSGGSWDATDNGIYTVAIEADEAADTSGNFVAAGNFDNTFEVDVDTSSPSVVIAAGGPTSAPIIHFTVTFSEPVTGFDASDVDFTGNVPTIVQVTTQDGITYDVTASGMPGSGDVTATIPSEAATDLFGNPSTASGSASVTYTLFADQAGVYRAGNWTVDANGNRNPADDTPIANLDAVLIGLPARRLERRWPGRLGPLPQRHLGAGFRRRRRLRAAEWRPDLQVRRQGRPAGRRRLGR